MIIWFWVISSAMRRPSRCPPPVPQQTTHFAGPQRGCRLTPEAQRQRPSGQGREASRSPDARRLILDFMVLLLQDTD